MPLHEPVRPGPGPALPRRKASAKPFSPIAIPAVRAGMLPAGVAIEGPAGPFPRPAPRSNARQARRRGRDAPPVGHRSPGPIQGRAALRRTGGDLLSQGVAPQVPSAQSGLTALFGMGRGVSHSPCATGILRDARWSLKTAQGLQSKVIKYPSSPRPISTSQLNALLRLHRWPINLVVYQGSYSLKGMGEFISRTASRLDAFSGYPFRA
jgi:hypothetical protein